MIINQYRFTKKSLEITMRLLKKNYEEGWEALNFTLSTDNLIRLTDNVFHTQGDEFTSNDIETVFVFGFLEYQRLTSELLTTDVQVLTDDIYLKITDKKEHAYKRKVIEKLKELKDIGVKLEHAYIGNKKYDTYEEVIAHYVPEWDMELVFSADNNVTANKKILLRYRGNSSVIQAWLGDKLVTEEVALVNDKGDTDLSLVGLYKELG